MHLVPPFRVLLLAAPSIFVAHVLEEAPGFVTWFNAHVARGITAPLFWTMNCTALGITIAVVALEWVSGTALSVSLVVAWLSFLMLANAFLHVGGSLVDGAYVPGLVTAVLLYLPFFTVVVRSAVRLRRLPRFALAVIIGLGALPMLTHGYLILFRGDRLF